ncbi:hypothetical protein PG993_014818 [Apiospora rasikravindrae]|uniref:Uncharacterized protein n=1 Tax=Apiospora rasikravindrae TaxID=990691 RepID=A0ABR1RNV0_9PEZI
MADTTHADSIRASMAFLRDLKLYEVEKPYHLTLTKDREADSTLTNIVHDVYDNIEVTNIRGCEDAFRLDVHGFQLLCHKSSLNTNDFSFASAREKYSNEIAGLLKSFLGAQEVRLMHCMVRDRSLPPAQEHGQQGSSATRGRPIPGVHIDASPEGGYCSYSTPLAR